MGAGVDRCSSGRSDYASNGEVDDGYDYAGERHRHKYNASGQAQDEGDIRDGERSINGDENSVANSEGVPSGTRAPAGGTTPAAGTDMKFPTASMPTQPGATTLAAKIPKDLEPFRAVINEASRITGIPADRVAAHIWAEARDDIINHREATPSVNPDYKKGIEKRKSFKWDEGYFQISQGRFNEDVSPKFGDIKLNVKDRYQGILAGVLELKTHVDRNRGDLDAGAEDYVGKGVNSEYVPDVREFAAKLDSGRGDHLRK